MTKKYQVFISSTFVDLKGARSAVSEALLRANCFPAGMELFPAADQEQFDFIKTVIDQSDYYLLISAGKYGSIHPQTGLSYTEMEYDYAMSTGKPIMRLIHDDPFGSLPKNLVETSEALRIKLLTFHSKLKSGRLVRTWDSPEALQVEVLFALQEAQRAFPVAGWIRGDGPEMRALENKLSALEEAKVDQPIQTDEHPPQSDLANFDYLAEKLRARGQSINSNTTILAVKALFDRLPSVFKDQLEECLLSVGYDAKSVSYIIDALGEDDFLKVRSSDEVIILPKGKSIARKTSFETF